MSKMKIQPLKNEQMNQHKQKIEPYYNNNETKSLQNTSNKYRLKQQVRQIRNSKSKQYSDIQINTISQNRVQIILTYLIKNNTISLSQQFYLFQQDQLQLKIVIILHQAYPWTPPFVICATQIMFPRLDDYRDYLEDILQGEWWPSVTAFNIIEQIPKFITYKLTSKMQQNNEFPKKTSFDLGKRICSDSTVHSLQCIGKYCKGLKLCIGEYFNSRDVLIGKYQNIVLGVCWSDIVVFKQHQSATKIKAKKENISNKSELNSNQIGNRKGLIIKKWSIRQIKKIQSKKLKTKSSKRQMKIDKQQQKEKRIKNGRDLSKEEWQVQTYQFCIKLMNGKTQYIRMSSCVEEIIEEMRQMRQWISRDVVQDVIFNDVANSELDYPQDQSNQIQQVQQANKQQYQTGSINRETVYDKNHIINFDDQRINHSINKMDVRTQLQNQSKMQLYGSTCRNMNSVSQLNNSQLKQQTEQQPHPNILYANQSSDLQLQSICPNNKQHIMNTSLDRKINNNNRKNGTNRGITGKDERKEAITLNGRRCIQTLRHIIQYIQLRECVLSGNEQVQAKIRMLSKVMENASDLDQETQLQLYYASKLKEIIYNEYVQEDDAITSKFEFDI